MDHDSDVNSDSEYEFEHQHHDVGVEIFVVAFAHAGSQPRAVMVHFLYAVVADAAVASSWRSEAVALLLNLSGILT